jgi:hypothetical protein
MKGRKPASRFKSIVESVMPDRPGFDDNIVLKTKRHIAFKVDRQVMKQLSGWMYSCVKYVLLVDIIIIIV